MDGPSITAQPAIITTKREQVIGALRHRGHASRADVARVTGLSRTTVSSVVSELLATGVAVERGHPGPAYGDQGGRPSVPIELDGSAGIALGIDFGHRHIRVAVADLAHQVLAETRRDLDVASDAQRSIDVAGELVDQALTEAGARADQVIGAGVGLPAPVDPSAVAVGSGWILPGWADVDAREAMSSRLATSVAIDNDANLGALAEATWGAGRGCEELVYVKGSSGIGAGLIVSGRLHRGARGTAGEIGHLTADPAGPLCRCGKRGCLEAIASAGSIARQLGASFGHEMTFEEAVAMAAKESGAARVIADAGWQIGKVLGGLCDVLNPQAVVIGGDLADAGPLLLDPIAASIERHAIPSAAQLPIRAGELGERATVLGALALVIRDVRRFASAPVSGGDPRASSATNRQGGHE